MITLTAGGVTIYATEEDAPFYMRLGYVVVPDAKQPLPEPLPASPFVPDGKNGEEAAPTAPTVKRKKK